MYKGIFRKGLSLTIAIAFAISSVAQAAPINTDALRPVSLGNVSAKRDVADNLKSFPQAEDFWVSASAGKVSIPDLKIISRILQKDTVEMLYRAGSGHPGGSLSMIDMITTLYFGGLMRYDPNNPEWENRDRFVLSKGHAAPGLYAALAETGFFSKAELKDLRRKIGAMVQGHTDMTATPGVDMSAGSIGVAISAAVGMAMAAKMKGRDYNTYCMLGDGEVQEGQVDEAARHAAAMGLDNLIAFLDWNGMQIDGEVRKVDVDYKGQVALWKARGWNVIAVDGHDMNAVVKAVNRAKRKKGKPTIIIARTIKGKGLPGMAKHGAAPNKAETEASLKIIKRSLAKLGGKGFDADSLMKDIRQKLQLSKSEKRAIDSQNKKAVDKRAREKQRIAQSKKAQEIIAAAKKRYGKKQEVATRTAGGDELVLLGAENPDVVAFAADLRGSVKMDNFAKAFGEFSAKNPQGRYAPVGIREAHMFSMAAGMAACGIIPVIATFSVFTERMLDQVKAILKANIPVIIVGTHVGLAVGPDGDSHQDAWTSALYAQLPNVKIYEGADGQEARILYRQAYENAKKFGGPQLIRLARPNTRILSKPEGWKDGAKRGFYTIYEKQLTAARAKRPGSANVAIVSTGVPTVDAIKAAERLYNHGIGVRVIDVTQLKEMISSRKNIDELAKLIQDADYVITVADALPHILEDKINKVIAERGFGNIKKVVPLGIQDFGESGPPKELYAKHGFDEEGIYKTAMHAVKGIDEIIADFGSGDRITRKRAYKSFKLFYPHLEKDIDEYYNSLPASGKAIFDQAKRLKKPVMACNIDNGGGLSALQIPALMQAAKDMNAFIIFEVGPGALLTYAEDKTQLPEYCAKVAYQIYKETGYIVKYAVHLDHNQIDKKKFKTEPEAAVQEAIDRPLTAINNGFTSVAIDTSTLPDLDDVISTAITILREVYKLADELGITLGIEGEIDDIGTKISKADDALRYVTELEEELGRIIDLLAGNFGSAHGFTFTEDDTLKPYEGGAITIKEHEEGKQGYVLSRAKKIARALEELKIILALHGFSSTPTEVAKLIAATGVVGKVNINTDWQAIEWKVLQAWYPGLYRRLFNKAYDLALGSVEKAEANLNKALEEQDMKKIKAAQKALGKLIFITADPLKRRGKEFIKDRDYDFEHAKNRIMFGFARKVFRNPDYHEFLEDIAKQLKNGKLRRTLVKLSPEQAREEYLAIRLRVSKRGRGLTALEAIHKLTYERAIEIMKAKGLKDSAKGIKVDRPYELRLQDWQKDKLMKAADEITAKSKPSDTKSFPQQEDFGISAITQTLEHETTSFLSHNQPQQLSQLNEGTVNDLIKHFNSAISSLKKLKSKKPEAATSAGKALRDIEPKSWGLNRARQAGAFSHQMLDKILETAKIKIEGAIVVNEKDMPQTLISLLTKSSPYRAELIERLGVNVVLASEYNPDDDGVINIIALSKEKISGLEQARYLNITTIVSGEKLLDITYGLVIAKGLLSYMITQKGDNVKEALASLLRGKIKENWDNLKEQLDEFVDRPGYVLKITLPVPFPYIKKNYFDELQKLTLQALIAA